MLLGRLVVLSFGRLGMLLGRLVVLSFGRLGMLPQPKQLNDQSPKRLTSHLGVQTILSPLTPHLSPLNHHQEPVAQHALVVVLRVGHEQQQGSGSEG